MKKSSVELTDSRVAKLKPRDQNYFLSDRSCPGFGVEVTPAGSKLFVVKTCLTVRGVQNRQRHTLGKWPTKTVEVARLEAANLKDQVRRGEDPKAAILAMREAVKVGELIDLYCAEVLQVKVSKVGSKLTVIRTDKDSTGLPEKGRSKKRYAPAYIENNIRPTLGSLSVRDVGTAQIHDLLFKIKKVHPINANRIRSVLVTLFKFAEIKELRPLGSNPVLIQSRSEEHSRERNLSDQEIATLGEVIRANEALPSEGRKIAHSRSRTGKHVSDPRRENPFAVAAIRLILLTGMRKGEALGLQWKWVDLVNGEILIPKEMHKTGEKTQKARIVRLCSAAQAILETLPKFVNNPYVFPGKLAGTHLEGLVKPWLHFRAAAGLAVIGEPSDEDVTIHDLRRTFGSVAARIGVPELFISALLGHAVASVTQVYARVGQDPLHETVEAIGGRIAGLLAGEIDPEQEARDAKVKRKASRKQA